MFDGGFKLLPSALLLFVLLFPTVLTYFLIPIGLKYLSSAVVALYGYVTLIVAAMVSFIMGIDKFEPVILLSLSLIGASIYLVGVSDEQANHK
jgi:drug/metabolite transporter (DMT)-like permease